MGFFGGIGDAIWGSAAKRAKGQYLRQSAQQSIQDIEAQQVWRSGEDPRERAHQTQGLWARGIGKSSMARQDRSRLDLQQSQRNTRLSQQHQLAKFYKLYVDRQARYEEISSYLSMADTIITTAVGFAAGGIPGAILGAQMGGGGGGGAGDFEAAPQAYKYGPGDYDYGGQG